ncbi:MAG TPA: LysM peptidoglycan-binding domain-containing protein [Patescibacteria group bacterium]|nr:LysM peptidoglycan-binding domain-containing protein [Patescibacteria group bacterium]
MTYYEPPQRARPRRRSTLDSPWLAGLLVVVVLGLVGTLFVGPALFGSPVATQTGALQTSGLPTATAAGPSLAPTFSRPTPSPGPTFRTYRVQSGDSLNSIAKKFHTTGRSIAWWNRGTYPSLDPQSSKYDPNTIRVGWVLMVMPGTVVDDANPPTPSPGPTEGPAAS